VAGDQVPLVVFIAKTENYGLVFLLGLWQLLQVKAPESTANPMLATDKQSWM
jgi:hypothetical protein